MHKTVQVLLPINMERVFDYTVPEGMDVALGSFVEVPFGKKAMNGVVWGMEEASFDAAKLKQVLNIYDLPPLSDEVRKFISFVARYSVAHEGAVLNMLMSVEEALKTPKPENGYISGSYTEAKLSPQRKKVLDYMKGRAPTTAQEIAEGAGATLELVRAMARGGQLIAVQVKHKPSVATLTTVQEVTLSPEQADAAKVLVDAVDAQKHSVIVLDGVTGSGKTEVYSAAISHALKQHRQVLVLLPEIALTHQFVERFTMRFGFAPTQWHSNLTPATRRKNWRAVAEGTARVVVGARSALFLPYKELGLIVVDEEHEPSYKQEEGVVYHGRDMAVARAFHEKIPAVLVSATPSLETLTNVESGKFSSIHLHARHAGATMPDIELIDLRETPPERGEFIAPPLKRALAETLAAGEQSLLFLNRRGYAPLTLCRSCGYRFQCASCSAWLVIHKKPACLQCHHCGHRQDIPHECPSCHSAEPMVPCGPGVERVEEEVQRLMPQARVLVLSSDSLSNPNEAADAFARIHKGEVDVIIGTQLVAKGHHFPLLTLVGLVDADLGLEGGDLRAAEKSYQLLHQVSGRAGREQKQGRVMLQSYMPQHPVMQALLKGDREAFMNAESGARKHAAMPPFARLAALVIAGEKEAEVRQIANRLAATAPRGDGVEVMGPAPAALSPLRGKYRWRLLMRTRKDQAVQKLLTHWLSHIEVPRSVRIKVDVDPYSFL